MPLAFFLIPQTTKSFLILLNWGLLENDVTKLLLLNSRLAHNATVQEGLSPNEDPIELLKELDQKLERFNYLVVAINKTNELTKNKFSETISELISKRDVMQQKAKALSTLINSGSNIISRLSHSEIRTISTFSVAETQKQLDKISSEIRKVDTQIQELNWTTDLIEEE